MLEIKTIAAVKIAVSDFTESFAFYKTHFGFSRKYGSPQGVLIGNKKVSILLVEVDDELKEKKIDPLQSICIIAFQLEVGKGDFARIEREFDASLIIDKKEHPRYKSIILADPDGHRIELIYHKPH